MATKLTSGMDEDKIGDETANILSAKVARLMGVLKLPDDFNYIRNITKALVKKYKRIS